MNLVVLDRNPQLAARVDGPTNYLIGESICPIGI